MRQAKSTRIWELDALRGILILLVIVIHAVFDIQYFILRDLTPIPGFSIIQNNTGEAFILLSGLCVTLGRRPFHRGLQVFACGMLITAVTVGMSLLGFSGSALNIYFGILHLLGSCMMLYPLFQKLPISLVALLGAGIIALGLWFATFRVSFSFLFPFGLMAPDFASGDYFPLLPHLGWFLLGSVIGRTAYREKKSLLPNFPAGNPILRFFQFCGRKSLWIYLIHQPILYFFIAGFA